MLLTAGGACTADGPPSRQPTVVTLGDSVPAGTGCDCVAFPEIYARQEQAVSLNLAEPGLTSADVLELLGDPSVGDDLRQADDVLIMVGANDVADSFPDPAEVAAGADEVRANVRATIDGIRKIHVAPVIVLGYWNVVRDGKVGEVSYGVDGVEASAEATKAVNDALESAATSAGAVYLSTEPVFHGPDGEKDPTTLLAEDGDHPDSAGHEAIARLLPTVGAEDAIR